MRPRCAVFASLLAGCAEPTPVAPAPAEPPTSAPAAPVAAAPVTEPDSVYVPDPDFHPAAYVAAPPRPRLAPPTRRCFGASRAVEIPEGVGGIRFLDVNRDRRPDILKLDDKSVVPLIGRADGSFIRRGRVEVGHDIANVIAGDVTRDGKLDLVVLADYGEDTSLLVGRGDGSFRKQPLPGVRLTRPQAGLIADFTGDRQPEIAVLTELTIVVLHPAGETFVVGDAEVETGPAHGPQAADFDADGKLDLLVPESVGGDGGELMGVYLGKGNGTFAAPIPVPGTVGGTAPVIADLDGDGHLDLALTRHYQDSVTVVRGDGTGRFSAHVEFPIEAAVSGMVGVDVTRDGRLDLLVGGAFGLDTFANDGTGRFTPYARDGAGALSVSWAGDAHGDAAVEAVVDDAAGMRMWTGVACHEVEAAAAAQPKRRACTDGESLASGCDCTDRRCMDICCVGSACSHGGGPDQAWAKCVSRTRR